MKKKTIVFIHLTECSIFMAMYLGVCVCVILHKTVYFSLKVWSKKIIFIILSFITRIQGNKYWLQVVYT